MPIVSKSLFHHGSLAIVTLRALPKRPCRTVDARTSAASFSAWPTCRQRARKKVKGPESAPSPRPYEGTKYQSFADKVDCIPFAFPVEQVSPNMDMAAYAHTVSMNPFNIVKGLILDFLQLIGLYTHKPPARRIGVQPLYVPIWALSLVARATAWSGEIKGTSSIIATAYHAIGTRFDPLDKLRIGFSPTFAKAVQWNPQSPPPPPIGKSEQEAKPLKPIVLPFTLGPFQLLERAQSMSPMACQVWHPGSKYSGNDEAPGDPVFRWDPRSVEIPFVAAHPVYVPLYLGEYEAADVDGHQRRVTVAYFAGKEHPGDDGTNPQNRMWVWKTWKSPSEWITTGPPIPQHRPMAFSPWGAPGGGVGFSFLPSNPSELELEDLSVKAAQLLAMTGVGAKFVETVEGRQWLEGEGEDDVKKRGLEANEVRKWSKDAMISMLYASKEEKVLQKKTELAKVQAGLGALESEMANEDGNNAEQAHLVSLSFQGISHLSKNDLLKRIKEGEEEVKQAEEEASRARPSWTREV